MHGFGADIETSGEDFGEFILAADIDVAHCRRECGTASRGTSARTLTRPLHLVRADREVVVRAAAHVRRVAIADGAGHASGVTREMLLSSVSSGPPAAVPDRRRMEITGLSA